MRQVSCADLCPTERSSYRRLTAVGTQKLIIRKSPRYDSMDGVGVASCYGIVSQGHHKLRDWTEQAR
jgi:hypothetical protein